MNNIEWLFFTSAWGKKTRQSRQCGHRVHATARNTPLAKVRGEGGLPFEIENLVLNAQGPFRLGESTHNKFGPPVTQSGENVQNRKAHRPVDIIRLAASRPTSLGAHPISRRVFPGSPTE